MHRTNIYLTDEQRAQLDARARAEGVSRAELIRRVLDQALGGEADRLTADLAAIEQSFRALGAGTLTVDRRDGAREEHLARLFAR